MATVVFYHYEPLKFVSERIIGIQLRSTANFVVRFCPKALSNGLQRLVQ
jgi:hypothetical protein